MANIMGPCTSTWFMTFQNVRHPAQKTFWKRHCFRNTPLIQLFTHLFPAESSTNYILQPLAYMILHFALVLNINQFCTSLALVFNQFFPLKNPLFLETNHPNPPAESVAPGLGLGLDGRAAEAARAPGVVPAAAAGALAVPWRRLSGWVGRWIGWVRGLLVTEWIFLGFWMGKGGRFGICKREF